MRNINLKEFEKIIDQYQNQLIRFAFFRTGSYAEAQDIVQNVFVRLFEKQLNFQLLNNPKSFLYKIISNECIDFGRRKKIEIVSIENIIEPLTYSSTNSNELIEEYQRIDLMLKYLPDEQKEVVKLRVLDELDFKEIAEILEIPIPTVKSRFKYGIEKVRNQIKVNQEVTNEL
ncbi:MAG: RNA polymerase sigma factor [Bacteroidota bacterium]